MAESSQEVIAAFWKNSLVPEKPPTKVTAILPPEVLGKKALPRPPQGPATAEPVTLSYETAKKECIAKVAKIVRECRRINEKYNDPYFDLEDRLDSNLPLSVPQDPGSDDSGTLSGTYDLMKDNASAGRIELYANDTSEDSFDQSTSPSFAPSVKRIADIFDNPQFFVDGASSQDIKQGQEGDCWFLSALSALCSLENGEQLLEKVCPAEARDPEVGIYGFLFFRDGEWTSVVIDDKLYLLHPDYDYGNEDIKEMLGSSSRYDSAEEYRKTFQSNSRALYKAQSTHPDETWIPLIEKAFAKAHNDYGSIDSGWPSDGVEDLTGGSSAMICSTNILSKDKFWTEGLLHVNKDFLFGLATQTWWDRDGSDGIQSRHAYSVLRAVDYGNERLVMIKNPWGKTEWNGPWSDGSKEWTSQALKDLEYTFGNDGIFWMRFSDMLRKYGYIFRTRLFSPDWNVTTQWTQVSVPWAGETRDPRFSISISQAAPTVIVLSQLDDRYFRGLLGQYEFRLSFRLYKEGEDDYIIRTLGEDWWDRSINVETNLEAGRYEVRLHISARRTDAPRVEDVIKSNWLERPEKLLRVGASYDFAHAKGRPLEEEQPEADKSEVETTGNSQTTAAAPAPTNAEATPATQDVTQVPQPVAADTASATAESQAKPSESQADLTPSTSNGPVKSTASQADATSATPSAGNVNGTGPLLGAQVVQNEANSGESEAAVDKPAVETSEASQPEKNEPWGAVCVVGLRVYCKNAEATVEVSSSKASPKPKLDVDNPSKDIADSTA